MPRHDPDVPGHDSPHDGHWEAANHAADLPEHLQDVNARADASDHGLSLFDDPRVSDLADKVPPDPDGAFDLNLHGDANGALDGGTRLSAQDLLDLAKANGHQDGQPIRLTSCEAGKLDDGLAAELARLSGSKVIAADSPVWTDSAGHMFASGAHTDSVGREAPDIPPTGNWKQFNPDGTTDNVGTDGFPPGQEHGFGDSHAPTGDVAAHAKPDDGVRRDSRGREIPDGVERLPSGKLPSNFEWAGKKFAGDTWTDALKEKYPDGVWFTKDGFPDFSPYAISTQVIPGGFDGNYTTDFTKANQMAGFDTQPRFYIWHHHQDGETMQLVPADLHNGVRHAGGKAIVSGKGKAK